MVSDPLRNMIISESRQPGLTQPMQMSQPMQTTQPMQMTQPRQTTQPSQTSQTSQSKGISANEEFGVFEFQTGNLTYAEKERVVNKMLDSFDEQKRNYNRQRRILEETVFLFVLNHQTYQKHIENKNEFRQVETQKAVGPFPSLLTDENVTGPLAIAGYESQSDKKMIRKKPSWNQLQWMPPEWRKNYPKCQVIIMEKILIMIWKV